MSEPSPVLEVIPPKPQPARPDWVQWALILGLASAASFVILPPHWGLAILGLAIVRDDLLIGWWWFRRDSFLARRLSGMLLLWCRAMIHYSFSMLTFGVVVEFVVHAGHSTSTISHDLLCVGGYAMTVTLMMSTLAIVIAWLDGVKLWLDDGIRDSWQSDTFPPRGTKGNRADWLLKKAIVFGVVGSISMLTSWNGIAAKLIIFLKFPLILLLYCGLPSIIANTAKSGFRDPNEHDDDHVDSPKGPSVEEIPEWMKNWDSNAL